MGWVHVPFYWAVAQPVPGPFAWGAFDPVVDEARVRGMEVLGQLGYTTQWNTTAPGGLRPSEREHYPPSDYAAWERYVFETVSRYKGRIRYWEVWNEPDLQGFWHGTPAEYARLLAVAHDAVRRADPRARVLLAGLSLGGSPGALDEDFLREILSDPRYPAGRYFDIANYHQYGSLEEARRRMSHVRSELARAGLRRPVWITEVGYGTDPRFQADPAYQGAAGQAAWLEDTLPALLELGAEKVFWFKLYDGSGETSRFASYGLLDAALRPKPALRAYARLIAGSLAPRIAGRGLRASGSGRVRVRLSCPSAAANDRCRGELSLVSSGRTRLGAHRYSIRHGKAATVAIPLSRRGRELLESRRRLRVEVRARASACRARACVAKRAGVLRTR